MISATSSGAVPITYWWVACPLLATMNGACLALARPFGTTPSNLPGNPSQLRGTSASSRATGSIVVQRLDVEHLILDSMTIAGYQAFMNNPRACLRVALVAIATQDSASCQQGHQWRLELLVTLVQQHCVTLPPNQGWHQGDVSVAPAAMSSRWPWHLATPLERLWGKHLIRLNNAS